MSRIRSARAHSRAFSLRSRFRPVATVCLSALLIFPFGARTLRAQDKVTLDGLAADVAAAIAKSSGRSHAEVVVLDFGGGRGTFTVLGVKLADEFAAALAEHVQGFNVLSRADFTGFTPGDLADSQASKCYGAKSKSKSWPPVVISGTFDEFPGQVALQIRLEKSNKQLYERSTQIPLTDEVKAMVTQPRPIPANLTWTSPDYPPSGEPPNSGAKGVGFPSCSYCPQAQYSDRAVNARLKGSVTLMAVISAEGLPVKITVVRGLSCGLNEKAIESLKSWRFHPALDSAGQPMAVRQIVQISFHLY